MTLDLEAIKAHAARCPDHLYTHEDVAALVAEVERLQGELQGKPPANFIAHEYYDAVVAERDEARARVTQLEAALGELSE